MTEAYRGPDGRLRVVTLARPLDSRLTAAASRTETRPAEALGDDTIRSIVRAVAIGVGTLVEKGYPPIILTTAGARALLKDLTHADLPRLVVLSQSEIPRDTPIEVLGSVIEEEPAAVTTYSTSGAMA
jgi:flagellar biosynthesis protein FlhA